MREQLHSVEKIVVSSTLVSETRFRTCDTYTLLEGLQACHRAPSTCTERDERQVCCLVTVNTVNLAVVRRSRICR